MEIVPFKDNFAIHRTRFQLSFAASSPCGIALYELCQVATTDNTYTINPLAFETFSFNRTIINDFQVFSVIFRKLLFIDFQFKRPYIDYGSWFAGKVVHQDRCGAAWGNETDIPVALVEHRSSVNMLLAINLACVVEFQAIAGTYQSVSLQAKCLFPVIYKITDIINPDLPILYKREDCLGQGTIVCH